MNGENEESVWWAVQRHFKLLLLAIGSPILVYFGFTSLLTALRERSPSHFTAERFAEDYRDQQWIQVEGRLAVEYAYTKAGNTEFVYVDVPLVPLDWQPDQAVHIIGRFYLPRSEVYAWKAKWTRSPQCTLTGQVLDSMQYWDMFPTLTFAEPIVYINEGDSPFPLIFNLFMLALGGFMFLGSWTWLLRIVFLRGGR